MPYSTRAWRPADAVHRWGLLVVVGALLAILWSLVLWSSAQQQQRLMEESARELALMNGAVAQQAGGLLRAIETDLRTMELWLHAHVSPDPLHDPSFLALVNEMRRASEGLIDLRMVSVDGNLFYVTPQSSQALADVNDREYFKAHLPPSDTHRSLHISAPVLSRVTQTWIIPVSWRMSTPVGGALVLFAAIQLENLSDLHDRVRFKPGGSIAWMRTDGVVLSRTPVDNTLLGKDLSASSKFQSEYGRKGKGSFLSDGKLTDGVERLISYERLDDYPVTVLVSRNLKDVLDPYHARRQVLFSISGGVTLLAVAFAFFLQRSQRALHGAQKELKRLATTDHLTEVMNRRALSEMAQAEFGRAQRFGREVAVLALDIDHFKRVNDTHGHSAGDHVLKECAVRWKAALRAQDLLGRLGGEEFCVVLPETSREAAEQVAERLRSAVSEPPLPGIAQATVSIGLSCRRPSDTQWSMALERADRALYRAKAEGRNCVRIEE